jgi:hypothetical protein
MRWDQVTGECLQDGVTSNTTTPVSVAYRHDLDGILELVAHEGALYPVTALPEISRSTAATWQITGRGRDWLHGRIVGSIAAAPLNSSARSARVEGWIVEEEV